jgi:CheY-like chemotaxis protein
MHKLLLHSRGIHADVMSSGRKAWEHIQGMGPVGSMVYDAILVDLTMEWIGGRELIRYMREAEAKSNVSAGARQVCIAVLGNTDTIPCREVLQMGFDYVVSNPLVAHLHTLATLLQPREAVLPMVRPFRATFRSCAGNLKHIRQLAADVGATTHRVSMGDIAESATDMEFAWVAVQLKVEELSQLAIQLSRENSLLRATVEAFNHRTQKSLSHIERIASLMVRNRTLERELSVLKKLHEKRVQQLVRIRSRSSIPEAPAHIAGGQDVVELDPEVESLKRMNEGLQCDMKAVVSMVRKECTSVEGAKRAALTAARYKRISRRAVTAAKAGGRKVEGMERAVMAYNDTYLSHPKYMGETVAAVVSSVVLDTNLDRTLAITGKAPAWLQRQIAPMFDILQEAFESARRSFVDTLHRSAELSRNESVCLSLAHDFASLVTLGEHSTFDKMCAATRSMSDEAHKAMGSMRQSVLRATGSTANSPDSSIMSLMSVPGAVAIIEVDSGPEEDDEEEGPQKCLPTPQSSAQRLPQPPVSAPSGQRTLRPGERRF